MSRLAPTIIRSADAAAAVAIVRDPRTFAGVIAIVLSNVGVAFGSVVLFGLAGVFCSSDSRQGDPTICTNELTWPLLMLALTTAVSLSGAALSLKRHSFEPAVLGVVAAVALAPVTFAIMWSIE